MSLVAVFRKDFADAVRSRALWGAVAVFLLFAGLLTFGYTDYFQNQIFPEDFSVGPRGYTLGLVLFLSGQVFPPLAPMTLIAPVIGLLLGYKAIVGERESGQLKFLLGLPHTRGEVVAGKLLARGAVGAVATVVGLGAVALLLVRAGGFAPLLFLSFAVVTLWFVLTYVSVGIAISAGSSTSGWATLFVVAFFGVFQIAWGGAFALVEVVFFDPDPPPDWFLFVRSLSPVNAYGDALKAALSWTWAGADGVIALIERATGGTPPPGPRPFYLADWFGMVLLVLWVVVPVGLGYWKFRRDDLG